MKKLSCLVIFLFTLSSCSLGTDYREIASNTDESKIQVYMSPTQGKQAFNKMYKMIKNAEKEVNITIYSWSDKGFTKALRETLERKNPPQVRVVMRKSVFKKHAKTIAELEKKGAMFKSAKIELHEKFILVDGHSLVNSSANMSAGAKNKYSENFIFFDSRDESDKSDIKSILKDFKQEFAIIWNNAHDYITPNEKMTADVLNHKIKRSNKMSTLKDIFLVSSSMNYRMVSPSKKDFNKGSNLGLKRMPNKKNQVWRVRDVLIKAIQNAKKSIELNINHFNIRQISDELIEAVKRGVDVKIAVDSQEFKTFINNKEMTPQFVKDYKKLKGKSSIAPVRIKFYSFVPHHTSWSLNHHKSILIDYDPNDTSDTVLITGSYNYSKTAEHSKFDNQVVIKGNLYKNVYEAFNNEFNYLWFLERTESDEVKKEHISFFTKGRSGLIPLHTNKPFSLIWGEAVNLKRRIAKLHPESRTFFKFKHCQYFSPTKKIFLKRNSKTICE